MAGKASITSGLCLGRSEVLRSLRHYLRAQSQGNHTIDRLEERGVERGFFDDLPWRTRSRHRQSDEHRNYFKGNVGVTSEIRGGAHMGSADWTKVNSCECHKTENRSTVEKNNSVIFMVGIQGTRTRVSGSDPASERAVIFQTQPLYFYVISRKSIY